MKPFAESCAQNQAPIYAVLERLLANSSQVLEIGSGTGQHAVYFAKRMPHLLWHTSDREENHHGIQQWLDDAQLPNTRPPIALDVSENRWPALTVDAVFSANAVHIMAWHNVVDYFTKASQLLEKEGLFILYGPFNYDGAYTSDSNARFDQWLKARDPASGIRDFEALNELADNNGLSFVEDIEMPANNRILCWKKRASHV